MIETLLIASYIFGLWIFTRQVKDVTTVTKGDVDVEKVILSPTAKPIDSSHSK